MAVQVARSLHRLCRRAWFVRTVGFSPLLPSALLTAPGTVGVQYGSHPVMPGAVARGVAEFGPFGLMPTLMSWLVAASAVVVFAITIGAFVAEEEPPRSLLGAPEPPRHIDPPQL